VRERIGADLTVGAVDFHHNGIRHLGAKSQRNDSVQASSDSDKGSGVEPETLVLIYHPG
jgi:hypothetical protein